MTTRPRRKVLQLDVLIATAKYLWLSRKLKPSSISIPTEKGRLKADDRRLLQKALSRAGVPTTFLESPQGPDLVARSATQIWQVECAGAGGKQQTEHTKFQRALAQCCRSYTPSGRNRTAYLALALPRTRNYVREMEGLKHLRPRLKLWILFYNRNKRLIVPRAPSYSAREPRVVRYPVGSW